MDNSQSSNFIITDFNTIEIGFDDTIITIFSRFRREPYLKMKQPVPLGAVCGYEIVCTSTRFGVNSPSIITIRNNKNDATDYYINGVTYINLEKDTEYSLIDVKDQ